MSTRKANPDLIVWIDTETTGLSAQHDLLLEIAVVVTDNALNAIGDFSIVVAPPAGAEDAVERMDDFVRDMHSANGLIDAIGAPGAVSPAEADRAVADAIDAITAGYDGPFLLGGNSITHDRGFLAVHAPETFTRLHYRSIDVSGIEQELGRDGYASPIAAWRQSFTPSDSHRALGDIQDSIRQLTALRRIRSQATS